MIIDCHCHAGTGDGLTGPWDTRAPLQDYLRRASAAGIRRTVLFAAFHSNYAVANQEVAHIVAGRPGRFYGFAFVHPERDRGRVHELVKIAAERHGFVGIKVHRHDAAITREICTAARTFALPVLYDVAGEVSVCELLAQEYPDVNFIIPHLGSFADDWRAQLALTDHRFATRIFTPTQPGYGGLICWNKPSNEPGRPRFCSVPMGRGFILESNLQKSELCGCRRLRKI